MFDKARFVEEMHTQGYSIVPDVLSPEFIQKAKTELMQAIDKEAQAIGGWHTARRGVRRVQKAGFLKIGHDAADRRRRQLHVETLGQALRADGLARFDVGVDDLPEDGAGAFVEFVDHECIAGPAVRAICA